MINNSSINRWNRLENKSLDQQFINKIIYGLSCSPFEASVVLDTVYKVFGSYFESGSCLQPGQIRLSILSIDAKVSQSISKSKQITYSFTPIRKKMHNLRPVSVHRCCRCAFPCRPLKSQFRIGHDFFGVCAEKSASLKQN